MSILVPPSLLIIRLLAWCLPLDADFGVAIWGKDFDQEDHAEKIKEANEQAYRPTVDVFLPVCNEHIALLRNTWNHIRALDYPNFAVHVLDDGAKDDVRDLAAVFGFNCEHRIVNAHLKVGSR